MKELFETIKIENGKIFNLKWHNQRLNRSRLELFSIYKPINLIDYIYAPPQGLYRCRVVYDVEVKSVQYIPYTPKTLNSFKIIQSNLEYNYKFNDRSELNRLIQEEYDEIIIEKDSLLTDTSIANIAFYNGQDWVTPNKPLLRGTTRERLLIKGFLKLENIKKEDIKNYSYFALMNAMIGFQIQNSINIKL